MFRQDALTWALAEQAADPTSYLERLHTLTRDSDARRAFHCFRLLLFSSRSYSETLLQRLEQQHRMDAAWGEEFGMYQEYRRGVVTR